MSKSYRALCSIGIAVSALVAAAPSASSTGRVDVTAGPATPRTLPAVSPSGIDEEAAQRVILESYRALAELVRAGGADLRFRIGDLQTFQADELDSVLWLDLVTMPEGKAIDVTRQRHTDRSSGRVAVGYRAAWRELPAEWVLTRDGQELIGSTAGDVLARAARSDRELSEVRALTSFEVGVTMAGAERTYRAVFLWLDEPDGQMRYRAVDLITQSVEHALSDRASAVLPAPPESGFRSVGATGTCSPWTTNHPANPELAADDKDHIVGYHYAAASFNVRCECTSACASKCVSSVTNGQCAESWNALALSACHRQGTSQATQSHTNANGVSGGAECTAGWGCGVKACVGCLCTVSVTVSIVGNSVQLASNANVWAKSHEHKVTCAPCVEEMGGGGGGTLPEPDQQDPWSSGGGGGGWTGSFGGGCFWSCSTFWNGFSYSETCSLIC